MTGSPPGHSMTSTSIEGVLPRPWATSQDEAADLVPAAWLQAIHVVARVVERPPA